MRALFIFFSVSIGSANVLAAQVNCETKPTSEYPSPIFRFQGTVDDKYLSGKDLQKFESVAVVAQEEKKIDLLEKDKAYKPRKGKNQNRSRFLFDLPATSESFDGIIHGVIFPTDLTKEESVEMNADGLNFRALVTSSTDSYHDGIISYFRLYCDVTMPILE